MRGLAERIWDWCDVLVLPTLSDNFGLLIAEALERGKRVITTDGAPVWEPMGSVGVMECGIGGVRKGDGMGGERRSFDFDFKLRLQYRDGSAEDRISLLEEAIKRFTNEN